MNLKQENVKDENFNRISSKKSKMMKSLTTSSNHGINVPTDIENPNNASKKFHLEVPKAAPRGAVSPASSLSWRSYKTDTFMYSTASGEPDDLDDIKSLREKSFTSKSENKEQTQGSTDTADTIDVTNATTRTNQTERTQQISVTTRTDQDRTFTTDKNFTTDQTIVSSATDQSDDTITLQHNQTAFALPRDNRLLVPHYMSESELIHDGIKQTNQTNHSFHHGPPPHVSHQRMNSSGFEQPTLKHRATRDHHPVPVNDTSNFKDPNITDHLTQVGQAEDIDRTNFADASLKLNREQAASPDKGNSVASKAVSFQKSNQAGQDFLETRVVVVIRKSTILSLASMFIFILITVLIAAGLYVVAVNNTEEIAKKQELKAEELADTHAQLMSLLNVTLDLAETRRLHNITMELTQKQSENDNLIETQNQAISIMEEELDLVEETNKNMSQEFNLKLDVVVDSQKAQNESLVQQEQDVNNTNNDVDTISDNVNQELEEQKAEYTELNLQQEELLQNTSDNLSKAQEENDKILDDELVKQSDEIDSISSKQIELESSLEDAQSSVDNHSQEISSLDSSVEALEEEMDDCQSSPCVNGVCKDQVQDYTCFCFPGFTEKNCDVNGPSFECGAELDGNSHFDLGEWSPGSLYTLEVWVKVSSIPPEQNVIAGGVKDCSSWGLATNGSYFTAMLPHPNGCEGSIYSISEITLNAWYHVATTSDGSNVTLFVNGALQQSAQVRTRSPGTARGFYIGKAVCCDGWFNGTMKSLRLWKRNLSQSEIIANMELENSFRFIEKNSTSNENLIGSWDFGETDFSSCLGFDHQCADWEPNDGDEISGVHCNVGTFFISKSFTINVASWNGTDGSGRVEIYAEDIIIEGTLTANGKGYKGGNGPTETGSYGIPGESYTGEADASIQRNGGGGGGGQGDLVGPEEGTPGAGGGYGENGDDCYWNKKTLTCGQGGNVYGDESLSVLHLGSGGGSGGNDFSLARSPFGGRGGNGGGAIKLYALNLINITGHVTAEGEEGQGDESSSCSTCPAVCEGATNCESTSQEHCYDFVGAGGGGSGGSLFIKGKTVIVDSNLISVVGGRGGYGGYIGCGGDGGRGRIRIDHEVLQGSYPDHTFLVQFNSTLVNNTFFFQPNTGSDVYLGCFEDGDPHHLLHQVNFLSSEEDHVTPDLCIEKCHLMGYNYSGTKNANLCFCDNQYGKYQRVEDVKNEDCSMACPGNPNLACGGISFLSIYGPANHETGYEDNGAYRSCSVWCPIENNTTSNECGVNSTSSPGC